MDISSLNSFLQIVSRPLKSPVKRAPFGKLPSEIINLIAQFFFPTSEQSKERFIRLKHIQILQSAQVRYPAIRNLISLEARLWKNALDETCRRKQQQRAGSLFSGFWRHPTEIIRTAFFPSPTFNKQPCMTYMKRGILYGDSVNELMNQIEISHLQTYTYVSLFPEQGRLLSLLAGTVVVGGIMTAVTRTMRNFPLATILSFEGILMAMDVEKESITIGLILSESKLRTQVETLCRVVYVLCMWCLLVNKVINCIIELRSSRVHVPSGIARNKYVVYQTKVCLKGYFYHAKNKLTEIWQIASIAFEERIALAQLIILSLQKVPDPIN